MKQKRGRMWYGYLLGFLIVCSLFLIFGSFAAAASTTYNAENQFSSVQGQNGWYYQYWDGMNYTNMTYDSVNKYWYGPSELGNYLRVYANKMHPGTGADAVRKWVAPADGLIDISAHVHKEVTPGGDGINAKIFHNGAEIFTAYIAASDTAGEPVKKLLTVNEGDAVYFITNRNNTNAYDTTYWDENIVFTPAGDLVYVRDYGAIPDDGVDDTLAIRAAISFAIGNNRQNIIFDAGRYDLQYEQPNTDHEAVIPHITISGANSLRLIGDVSEGGVPTTKLVRSNNAGYNDDWLPQIMTIEDSTDITLQNFIFDNDPFYYTAGIVTSISGNDVTVDILTGHPRVDGSQAYMMGSYDIAGGKNKKLIISGTTNVPSWSTISGGSGRLMKTTYQKLAKNVSVGDGVFWFQGGHGGPQFRVYKSEGIVMNNVRTYNATGFAYSFRGVKDISLNKVTLETVDNRIAIAPRDGIHMQNVRGKISLDGVVVSNMPGDDGLNVHGHYLTVKSVDGNTITNDAYSGSVSCMLQKMFLQDGTKVQLLDSSFKPAWGGTIKSWSYNASGELVITFNESLPAWVTAGTVVNPLYWVPDSFTVKNSSFINAGGHGMRVRSKNVVIGNTEFKYNAVAAVVIGSTYDQWDESQSPWNVVIKNSVFEDNKFRRLTNMQGQGVKIDQRDVAQTGLNGNINIYNNTFTNENVAISVNDAEDVYCWNNSFAGNTANVAIDAATTSNVVMDSPGSTLKVDSDAVGAIYYNESWIRHTNAGDYRGAVRRTKVTNNFAEFTFVGDQIKYYARKGWSNGIVDVYLDDVLVLDNYDLYDSNAITQHKVYENLSLPYGTHTIKIVNTGLKNPEALDQYTNIDFFEYRY